MINKKIVADGSITQSKNISLAILTADCAPIFLFDNNIIHRATIPKVEFRDAVVLQFKPSIKELRPYINREITGNGHQHTTFNVDPSILSPVLATEENHIRNQIKIIRQI